MERSLTIEGYPRRAEKMSVCSECHRWRCSACRWYEEGAKEVGNNVGNNFNSRLSWIHRIQKGMDQPTLGKSVITGVDVTSG
jgi:hypothetical protein